MTGEELQQMNCLSLCELIKKKWIYHLEDIAFCLLFGSRVTNRHDKNSDFDLMFVFKNPASSTLKSNLTLNYKKLHHDLNLEYSKEFPLEILALNDLASSLKGKGFNRVANGWSITPIYDSDWDSETDYRFWLCVLASQTMFIHGDYHFYNDCKKQAFGSLFFIVIMSNNLRSFSIASIIDLMIGSGKAYLGFEDLAVTRAYLKLSIEKLCEKLARQNILFYKNNQFSIINSEVFECFFHGLKSINEKKKYNTIYETSTNSHSEDK